MRLLRLRSGSRGRRTGVRRAALLAAVLLLAACGNGEAEEAVVDPDAIPDNPNEGVTADTIEIGWMGDVTGPTASAQTLNLAGTEAYFAKVNAEGGVLGRELVLHVRDDEYGAEAGVSNFSALIDDDRVLALMNVGGAHIQEAIDPDLQQRGIPLISPPQTVDSGLENPYIFNDLAHYGDQADVAVARMIERVGDGEDLRVAVVHLTVPSGEEWNAYISRNIEEVGGEYLGAQTFAPDVTDLSPIMASLSQLIDQEGLNAVAFHGAPAHALRFVNAMGDAGLDDLYVAGIQGMAGLSVFEEGDPDILPNVEGMHSFATLAADAEGAQEIREWVEGEGDEWADDARHINFTHGWVAGMTLHQAIERAAEQHGELTRETLFDGLQGPIDVRGLTCAKDYSDTNHAPCAAPFSGISGEMEAAGSFEDWAEHITERYGLASG